MVSKVESARYAKPRCRLAGTVTEVEMHRMAALLGLVLLLVASTLWVGQAQQPAAQAADDPRFTGKSTTMESKDLSIARRRFEAGARSAWHSHERGQLLFVEEGRMRTQKRGQLVKELGRGESDYTPSNMSHWHGAVPGQPLVQLNVGFGGETKWMDKVTDQEYQGKSQ
jgi:quercetin dioxygenase-like cupin family protein